MSGRPKSRSVTPLTGVLPFLRPYRWRIAAGLAALVCSSTATLVLPFFARGLLDHGFSAREAGEVGRYFLAFIAAAAVLGLSSATRFYFVTWLGERVTADIRRAVFDNVLGLTPAFFEITRTGEVLSRLTADTTLVQTVIGSSASVALRNLVTLSGGLILMFFTSLKLTLLILGAVLAIMVPLILFGRWVRALSRTSQDRIAESSARASETLNAVQTVQAFTHERQEKNTFGGTVEQSFAAAITRTRARAVMTAVVIFAFFTALASVLYVGAQDVIAQRMTGGLLLQFILLGGLVAGGVGSLSEVWGDLQRAAGASERLMELLHEKPAIAPPVHPRLPASPARGAIAFENITFHYPSRPDSAALKDFSLAIAPGEAVALVGPSGAGKSTVFQLLLRFFAAGQGRVLFDGVDITDLDPTLLRRHIAVVSQDPVIFSGSIASNIAYGSDDAGLDAVRRAADAAAATEFIEKLPNGFDTLVGERGVTLSGGQRQRLAIARAILRNAPLLLLDEATSALDAENELLVQQGLANLMIGRTTLVIAHRLATIQKLARIVVMDQGRVVAQGSHGELVGQGGLYARLAQLQFTSGSLDLEKDTGMSRGVEWAVKALLTWLAVLGVLAAGFALRYARVQGVFTSITPVLPSNCRSIANGLAGASDFEIDALHDALLISAQDGLYFLKLGNLTAAPLKLEGTPPGFHPGGISLLRNLDGSEILTVIDHRPGGRALMEGYGVISDGETAKLAAQSVVQGRSLVSPNSVTATAADHFYVTNDHVTTGALGRFAEDDLIWPHADIILNGASGLRIAAQRIAFPSGVLARHGFLYVAAANERRVIALNVEDFTGNLSEIGSIALPARLGNISMDTSGNLIVAGQSKPGASQVFRVRIDDKGVPVSFETIFSDDGHTLKGASAAAMWNGQLFISAAADKKLLACPLK